ncbi:type IX secretion system membrane protein PorP/SprF [uncultured Imperialibacter sp.]|uniref:PorP/SprF family type IX secretion system membrane protein n=1 Tax=uncultured Imperialibacter sp. TaxID=1672639 RepID=UPI0030D7A272
MRKVIYILGSLLWSFGSLQAQQAASYAQYMFNGLAINPAYAGSHEVLSATVISRFQNVGLEGAPNTQTFSGHAPLFNKNVALGALFIHDKFGVISQTGAHLAYAYRIKFGDRKYLSMGAQAGLISYRANYSQLNQFQSSDPVFQEDIRQMRPNFGLGAFFTDEKYYIGLSMPHLFNNVFDRGTDLKTVYQNFPIILTGGYMLTLTNQLKFKPNLLFKMLDQRPIELDVNANFLFDEILWAGLSYKIGNALNLIVQVQVTDQLSVGYSYAITTSPIRSVELGSHEMLLNYRFKYRKYGVITPRYF